MDPALKGLRERAISASLFRPGTLRQAIDRLGFIQADPIQSPARAQDLILRHRVKDYRAGDLARQYRHLGLEEDLLYAYGFMPQSTWRLLHPRTARKLSPTETRVLDFALNRSPLHPKELEIEFGRKRERNDWGGQSQSTTRTLQSLHYRGLLRVAERKNGIRLYEPVLQKHEPLDRADRLRGLVLLIASILGPLSEKSLRTTVGHLARVEPAWKERRSIVTGLIQSGDLTVVVADGVRYIWPASHSIPARPNRTVRFLAPFDPLVWDRRRFEHFWNWPYRFEAYTPAQKRQLGYYAMPMLWLDDVIGWVNVSNKGAKLIVEPGFKKTRPTAPAFEVEFQAEVARFETFLQKRAAETG